MEMLQQIRIFSRENTLSVFRPLFRQTWFWRRSKSRYKFCWISFNLISFVMTSFVVISFVVISFVTIHFVGAPISTSSQQKKLLQVIAIFKWNYSSKNVIEFNENFKIAFGKSLHSWIERWEVKTHQFQLIFHYTWII